jgi:ADP-ribosylglycohydrolase
MTHEERLLGLLVGQACGDALGLPREGLSPRRAGRLYGQPTRLALLPGGRGLCSDDTEHAFMTAQALLASGADADRFAGALAWRLRGWLLALPPATGLATLRAILRLWCGVSPVHSGVRSAGNGPLMRAPLLGAAVLDPERRQRLVDVSTRITHRDPLAGEAARALADAAAATCLGQVRAAEVLSVVARHLRDERWRSPLARVEQALAADLTPDAWARASDLARGPTGYVLHTLPAALLCWLRRPTDPEGAIVDAVGLGGDSDSVGAIVGALAGAAAGAAAVPARWRDGLCDWPLTLARLAGVARRLAALARGASPGPEPLPGRALVPLRNLGFLAIVLAHGLRRLLPPY